MKRYEIIPHTADIGVKVFGEDLKQLFENAAFGMFSIIADLDGLKRENSISLEIESTAENYEELLVAWLDELLYNFYIKQMIFFDFDVIKIESRYLSARVYGRHIGDNRNRLKTEVKAVTFHQLKIQEGQDGFVTQVIFDV